MGKRKGRSRNSGFSDFFSTKAPTVLTKLNMKYIAAITAKYTGWPAIAQISSDAATAMMNTKGMKWK